MCIESTKKSDDSSEKRPPPCQASCKNSPGTSKCKRLPPPSEKRSSPPRQRKWDQEQAEAHRRMEVLERENAAQFDEITRQMFTRLFHEAFHAYVENFVYPQDKCDVPRWLNEGLAQVFEEGILELGTLRLDAPSRTRLADMQSDFAANPDSRSQSSSAPMAVHFSCRIQRLPKPRSATTFIPGPWPIIWLCASRSWKPKDSTDTSMPARATLDPVARFEQLVGMPLDRFETDWRKELLRAQAAGLSSVGSHRHRLPVVRTLHRELSRSAFA